MELILLILTILCLNFPLFSNNLTAVLISKRFAVCREIYHLSLLILLLFVCSDGKQVGSKTCASVQIGQKVSFHSATNNWLNSLIIIGNLFLMIS